MPTTDEEFAAMDIVARIMAYEDQELDFDQTVELFQTLVDSGMVQHLQGEYGRTAHGLIGSGFVTIPDGETAPLTRRETDALISGWDPSAESINEFESRGQGQ